MKIYAKDYYFDYLTGPKTGDVFCGVDVSFSFKKDIDIYSEHMFTFSIYAGTPKGIARYMEKMLELKAIKNIGFFSSTIVVDEFSEEKISRFITNFFDSLIGNSANELIYKVMQHFDLDEDFYRGDNFYEYIKSDKR